MERGLYLPSSLFLGRHYFGLDLQRRCSPDPGLSVLRQHILQKLPIYQQNLTGTLALLQSQVRFFIWSAPLPFTASETLETASWAATGVLSELHTAHTWSREQCWGKTQIWHPPHTRPKPQVPWEPQILVLWPDGGLSRQWLNSNTTVFRNPIVKHLPFVGSCAVMFMLHRSPWQHSTAWSSDGGVLQVIFPCS